MKDKQGEKPAKKRGEGESPKRAKRLTDIQSDVLSIINPPGRPSEFTQELADAICALIASGWSLRRICARADMPAQVTVFRWLRVDETFSKQYARASEERAESSADEIIDVADEATDRDTAAAAKVRVDARKWIAAKLRPKKYGDYQKIEHGGKVETTPANFILNYGGEAKPDKPKS